MTDFLTLNALLLFTFAMMTCYRTSRYWNATSTALTTIFMVLMTATVLGNPLGIFQVGHTSCIAYVQVMTGALLLITYWAKVPNENSAWHQFRNVAIGITLVGPIISLWMIYHYGITPQWPFIK